MTDLDALLLRANELNGSAARAYAEGAYERAAAGFAEVTRSLAEAGLEPDPVVLCNEANCCLALSEPARALALYQQAGEVARRVGHAAAEGLARAGEGHVHQHRGNAAFAEDRPGEARDAYAEAVGAFAEAGAPELLGARINLAAAELALGRAEVAVALLEETCAQLPDADVADADERAPARAALWHNLGLARTAAGDLDGAHAAFTRAAALYDALDRPERYAEAQACASDVRRFLGDLDGAIAHHLEVVRVESERGTPLPTPARPLRTRLVDRSLRVHDGDGGLLARGAVGAEPVSRGFAHRQPAIASGGDAGPFVILVPACSGTWGPLFPRGATALASHLSAHGVPTLVVPLSHYVEPFDDRERVAEVEAALVDDVVSSLRPRAIGLSVTFSHLYPAGLRLARLARERAPDTPIVIGGPHVTYWDEACLDEEPAIDVVVRGEGEWTALELLNALERGEPLDGVAGITFRAPDGSVRRTGRRALGDVRELAPVDFELLPRAFAQRMEVSGVTSRGCAYRCRFCHEFRFWGGAVREYEPARIVSEMERLYALGNRMRGIDDSMLSMQSDYFLDLCRALRGSPYVDADFGFLTRVHTIDPAGVTAMKHAGLRTVSVGLESGSEAVLAAMNKGVDLAQTLEGLRHARDGGGLSVHTFFIVGHPGDNAEESEKTLLFVDRLFAEGLTSWLDVAMFTPYPGTPFFISPERHGVEILTLDWERWRRTDRPVAQLSGYPASAIYLTYLRMLQRMARASACDNAPQAALE